MRYFDHLPRLKRWLKSAKMFRQRFMRRKKGEKFLIDKYQEIFDQPLNTSAPTTFTGKLFCKMIDLHRQDNPLLTTLSDKFRSRDWVRKKIGNGHLVKLHWHGSSPILIPFDQLPERYVIKTNHGSGQVIVVSDVAAAENQIKRSDLLYWLTENFYWVSREPQYYNIKPLIMIEEFLDDGAPEGPLDYRFWCFHGIPKIIQIDNHLHSINSFYDADWNFLDLTYRLNTKSPPIPRPDNFQKMLEIAKALSNEFDFVRVDLYNIKGRICFGEMTFSPVGGALKFKPEGWDEHLGNLWTYIPT